MIITQKNLFPEFFEDKVIDIYKNVGHHSEDDIMGLKYCEGATFSGKFGIPLISSYEGRVPESFVTFSDMSSANSYNSGMAFFDCEAKLETLWRKARSYADKLKRYYCVTSPDFSLKIGNSVVCADS